MIFITVGSQKFPFDRLLGEVDRLVETGVIRETVYAQTGHSTYQPVHYRYEPFLSRDTYEEKMSQAEIVITHGGTGAIIQAVKHGKKVIAVPRLQKYGEHVDDHQLQIVRQFAQMNLIEPAYRVKELKDALIQIEKHSYQVYESNTARVADSIRAYIDSEGREAGSIWQER